MELIAVVLGADTSQNRFAACKSLLDYGFANYTLYTPAIQEGASVPVTLGRLDSVRAVPGDSPQLLVEKAKAGNLNTEISLLPEVEAPVAQGQQLGTLRVTDGGNLLAEIPLVAEAPVEALTWGDLMAQVLRKVAMAR